MAIRQNSRLRRAIGKGRTRALLHAIDVLGRILPHLTITRQAEENWTQPGLEWVTSTSVGKNKAKAKKKTKSRRTTARIHLGPRKAEQSNGRSFAIDVARLIPRTFKGAGVPDIDEREERLCIAVADALAEIMDLDLAEDHLVDAVLARFDERVLARHLEKHHRLFFDMGQLFRDLHRLSEQTYENGSIAFGCLVDGTIAYRSDIGGTAFSTEFLKKKKYRALSDGYRTAYVLSRAGRLRGFGMLNALSARVTNNDGQWFPSWAADLARASLAREGVGISLTRQGDVLVFDGGDLRLSYRHGHWQYWNHEHIVEMLSAMCRRQKVSPKQVHGMAEFVYTVALDIAFRRTGGLLVVLRRRKDLRNLVRKGDIFGDTSRSAVDADFDSVLARSSGGDRHTIAELAGLDGAVVFDGTNRIMAYAAILQPHKKGRVAAHEGSRTKAAIGASHYGLALKVSSDGDITAFYEGEEVFHI